MKIQFNLGKTYGAKDNDKTRELKNHENSTYRPK